MNQVYAANTQHFKYQPKQHQKHCIFLHGWDQKQNVPFLDSVVPPILQLKPFEDYLMPTMKRHGWTSHRIVYPSQLTFPEAAQKLTDYFEKLSRQHKLNFHNTVLIGYSTGGLVARVMSAYFNFPCTRLLTLASPHLGVRNLVLPFSFIPSVNAMLPNSVSLNLINGNAKDRQLRLRHDYFGITFRGHLGNEHSNDGLVDFNSATAYGLQNVQNRVRIDIPKREGNIDELVHNTEALNPKYVSPFLNQCKHTLAYY
ncbi:MAG: hypothetical protein R8M14_04590 [Ghiorsea sp.]